MTQSRQSHLLREVNDKWKIQNLESSILGFTRTKVKKFNGAANDCHGFARLSHGLR